MNGIDLNLVVLQPFGQVAKQLWFLFGRRDHRLGLLQRAALLAGRLRRLVGGAALLLVGNLPTTFPTASGFLAAFALPFPLPFLRRLLLYRPNRAQDVDGLGIGEVLALHVFGIFAERPV